MKLIVGLGNIGPKYLTTRHNIGFILLDTLAEELKLDWKEEKKLKASIAKHEDTIYAKPTTMMNLSGEAVSKIINFYKIDLQNLIVIHDDVDLPLGKIRLRKSGSAGTHNGMKSIITELGSQDFTRLRIGIESRGEHTPEQQDLSSFVLGNFTKEEFPDLRKGLEEARATLTKTESNDTKH